MAETAPAAVFYDPFAPQGEQFFDPLESYRLLEQRYAAGDVEHNYTADQFVADAAALVLDAHFTEKFEQAAIIEARMHQLCGGLDGHGDQTLSGSMKSNSVFGGHGDHDGHGHGPAGFGAGRHGREADAKGKPKKKQHQKRLARRAWPGLAAKLIELTFAAKND